MGNQRVQLTTGPLLLKGVANPPTADLNEVENGLDHAKAAIGRAIAKALARTGSPLKKFGDKGQIHRWTTGRENPNFARLWLCRDTRRELIVALAEESDVAQVEIIVKVGRIA